MKIASKLTSVLLLFYALFLIFFSFSSLGYSTEEDMLTFDEGLSNKPYRDIDGSIAIGIGRNLSSLGLSDDESVYLLRNDIKRVHKELSNDSEVGHIYLSLDENRRIAIRNMCFNMGITRLRQFKRMWAALKDRNYNLAAKEAIDSKWAKDVGYRAYRIAAIIRYGNTNSYPKSIR